MYRSLGRTPPRIQRANDKVTPLTPENLQSIAYTIRPVSMATKTTLKEFEGVFPQLVKDLLEHARLNGLPEEMVNWYEKVCTWTDHKIILFRELS